MSTTLAEPTEPAELTRVRTRRRLGPQSRDVPGSRRAMLAASIIRVIRENARHLSDDELCAIEAEARHAFYARYPLVESTIPLAEDTGVDL